MSDETRPSGAIPEPKVNEGLLKEILEILKDGPKCLYDIYWDIDESCIEYGHIEIVLEKLIDDGKVEMAGSEYRLVGAR